jgi:hypothetical protein
MRQTLGKTRPHVTIANRAAGGRPSVLVCYTPADGGLGHLLTVAVVTIVLRWLWKSSIFEPAKFEAGRHLFPPTRLMRILTLVGGVFFTVLFVWSRLALRQPAEWWVPWLFLGFVALALFAYPPVLSIEVDGIGSHSLFGAGGPLKNSEQTLLHRKSPP